MNEQDAGSRAIAESARSLGFGLVAGTLAGLPALVRGLGAGATPPPLALVGVCALPALVVAPVVVGLRRARAAQRTLPPEERARSFSALVGASVLLSLAPLTWLGSWLERYTHHRPLGAVTFACAALCVLSVALLLARRLAALQRTPTERLVRLACFVVAGGLGVYLLVGGAVASARWSSTWLDVTSILGWTAAAIWLPPLERHAALPTASAQPDVQPTTVPLRRWQSAVAAWLSVCVIGVLALVLHGDELAALTPVFTWPFR